MRRLSLLVAAALACAAPAPRADGWRIIGPGGGGSLFHPTVSPHDSRTVLVACDMTGAYLTHDGGAHWRIVNLGEPVRFFVFDPIDANVIYAKAGGIFRSADDGETWTRFFPRDVQNDHHGRRPRGGRTCTPPDGPPERSPPWPSTPPIRDRSTLRWGPPSGPPWMPAAPGRNPPTWADRRARSGSTGIRRGVTGRCTSPGRTRSMSAATVAGEPRSFPGPITDISGAPPVFYATIAGKIYVSTDGGVKWSESALPGFQGQAGAIAASRGASRDRLRLLQRTARAGALHLGRGQDHRFRAATGKPSTTTCATPG